MVDRDGFAPPSAGLQPAATLSQLPIHWWRGLESNQQSPKGAWVTARLSRHVKASPELIVGLEPTPPEYKTGALIQLGHISKYVGAGTSAQPGLKAAALSHTRLCPNIYTIHIVKELPGATKKAPVVLNLPGLLLELPWKVRCSSLPETILERPTSSLLH